MLFFQTLLLAGYGYAHAIARQSARRQLAVHAVVVVLALATMPLQINPMWKPVDASDPTWRILALLAASVGLPYALLSTTGPLVQSWFARRFPGASPYRLFALSNAASLLGVVAYPAAIEPLFEIAGQTLVWSIGFAVYALLIGALLWTQRDVAVAARALDAAPPEPWSTRLHWLALAATAVVLLLAFTSEITQNIAPVPFLWMLPLLLYLLSFILTFDSDRWYRREIFVPIALIGFFGIAVTHHPDWRLPEAVVLVPWYAITLFAACMSCHGELVRRRPAATRLTGFYLTISCGGALGGIFVALVAPNIFDREYELVIGIVGAAALGLFALPMLAIRRDVDLAVKHLCIVALIGVFVWAIREDEGDVQIALRNFYASLRVYDTEEDDGTTLRTLRHGVISHGAQLLKPGGSRTPTTYYGPQSGLGLAVAALQARGSVSLGVVGLGAGAIAAHARRGDHLVFYEINPQVTQVARADFTFLKDCPATLEVHEGDGRLVLERAAPQNFDLLALDAFSGDSIPIHLLTREALAIYLRHVKPGGVLAFNASNRYVDITHVLATLAAERGLIAVAIPGEEDEDATIYGTEWVIVTSDRELATSLAKPEGSRIVVPRGRPWTDSHANLLRALRWWN
jgi:SAM-dependent methyltransferase